MYRSGILKSVNLGPKVISVGGLTVGGSGKTPVLIHLAEILNKQNRKVLILTRGYGGEFTENFIQLPNEPIRPSGLSDEVRLMYRRTNCIIGVGPDRIRSYEMASEHGPFDVVLLDDGFQHLKIPRDRDILVLDSEHPFGNGFILPSGSLREPKSAMKYADLVVIAKGGSPDTDKEAIVRLISLRPDMPIVIAGYAVDNIRSIFEEKDIERDQLEGKSLFAFTSIALPETFCRTVEDLGLEISDSESFRDHHIFTPTDIREMVGRARADECHGFVVTEKDEVKLGGLDFSGFPVYSIRIRLQITGGEDSLDKLVAGAVND